MNVERLRALMPPSPAELRPNTGPPVSEDERQRWEARRLWAALMLALDLESCRSVLEGLPVRAGNLDAFVLRRALRGADLPAAEGYLLVGAAMLDAVAEAGPLPAKGRR